MTTETFEMLKSAYGEECLSRISVFEWHKRYINAQKARMKKSQMKIILTACFDAKSLFITNLCRKQTVNGKLYKEVIKRWIARVHRVGLSFRKVGPGIFCTTMHRSIFPSLSPSFWRNEGSQCYPIHPTPLIWRRPAFFFHKLKIAMKAMRFEAVASIQQTVKRELKAIREEAFSREFDSLCERCKPCAEAREDYIE
jgi:hypothetical protein